MSPPIRPLFTVPLLIGLAIIGGCGETSDGGAALPATFVAAEVPDDLDGGASAATLREAGLFAWQELIALNWPARPGTRDQADIDQPFGDPTFSGPLVWHTYRAKVEIAPGSGEPPGFVDDASQNFGYATVPPRYVYAAGEVPVCTGQASLEQPAWINLDEVSQLLVNRLYAGAAPDDAARRARNSQPQRVRYVAKANGTMYGYVVDPATSYWKQGDAFVQATSNFLVVANGNGTPARSSGPVIQFPSGTIEVKGAWRELTDTERLSGRFYQATVRYYEPDGSDFCYREDVWGLVGFHLIHKTPSAPYFIYATFEQADTLLSAGGDAVEDANGTVLDPSGLAMTPLPTFTDGPTPMISIGDQPFCSDPGARLFYQEMPIGFGGSQQTGIPTGGSICVNHRITAIPPAIVQVNADVHDAITRYARARYDGTSPWLFYKLVNVQWRPFDITEIDDTDADGLNNPATFWLANMMLETDNSLQFFSGQLNVNGARTDLPPNFDRFDPLRQTYQNVLLFDAAGNLQRTYNMGGCMGCHGTAAVQVGTDYSFLLADGPVIAPESLIED